MSTVENAVKTEVAAEKSAVEHKLDAVLVSLEARSKTWYEKHLPLLAGVAGLVIGYLVGHLVRL